MPKISLHQQIKTAERTLKAEKEFWALMVKNNECTQEEAEGILDVYRAIIATLRGIREITHRD